MTRTDLCVNKPVTVPVIFEPPYSIWTEQYVPKIQFLSSKYITLTILCQNASHDKICNINVWSCGFVKMLCAVPWVARYNNLCAGCLQMMFKSSILHYSEYYQGTVKKYKLTERWRKKVLRKSKFNISATSNLQSDIHPLIVLSEGHHGDCLHRPLRWVLCVIHVSEVFRFSQQLFKWWEMDPEEKTFLKRCTHALHSQKVLYGHNCH